LILIFKMRIGIDVPDYLIDLDHLPSKAPWS
jgi:hypothetical protein